MVATMRIVNRGSYEKSHYGVPLLWSRMQDEFGR
jgi:hypothetical protein